MTNSEAVEWLESQPFDRQAAVRQYNDAQDNLMTSVVQTRLFSIKEDHSYDPDECGRCYYALRYGSLIVIE